MHRDSGHPSDPGERHLGHGPWLVAAATVLLHLVAAGRYGVFRDELYYVACASRPAWGYVDLPPFSTTALAAWCAVFGDGVLALRIPAILLHAGVVLGTAWLAGRIGGRGLARTLAACTAAALPCALAVSGFYSMNAWDMAFWLATACLAALLLEGGDRRLWLALGAVAGIGLLNKYSLAWYLVGLTVGLLLSPARRQLRTRWPWLALGIAVLSFLPHVLWQVRSGWPTLEFIANARQYKMAELGPLGFWREQLILAHPLLAPIWLLGAVALLTSRRLRTHRPLGLAFVVVAIWLTWAGGKPYYLGPAYPPLLAAGAVQLECLVQRLDAPALRHTIAVSLVSVVCIGGFALAPLAIPVLPVQSFIRFQTALGLTPESGERAATGVLPQHFADRFGWQELAEAVAAVVGELPPEDRTNCLVVTANYGEAGALEYYWRRRPDQGELPAVTSVHNSYHLWGPGTEERRTVIFVGGNRERLERWFREVRLTRRHSADYAMPYESNLPIWVCRDPLRKLAEIWPEVGNYV